MACFIVPAAEAVIVTVVMRSVKKTKSGLIGKNQAVKPWEVVEIPLYVKLKWLSKLLWGGSLLLAFEHVWHGEVVPWFPFLTAAQNPQDLAEMLHEMATIGVGMMAVVTAAWICMVLVVDAKMKNSVRQKASAV